MFIFNNLPGFACSTQHIFPQVVKKTDKLLGPVAVGRARKALTSQGWPPAQALRTGIAARRLLAAHFAPLWAAPSPS